MIGNSLSEYLFIRTSITALRLVAPASILYLAASVWNVAFPISPLLGAVAIAEAGFFLVFYLPRKNRLQAPPSQPPPPLTKQQRQHFFEKCSSDLELIHRLFGSPYSNGWFLPRDEEFHREDAIDWILWSLFACEREHARDEWIEELDEYVQILEKMLGRKLRAGWGKGVKSIRLTFDRVKVTHRPLIWYTIVASVDTYSTIALFSLGFKHFSSPKWFQMFPPRPFLGLLSRHAATIPNVLLPYWYRPHRSNTKLPIVFLHGIGIGLYPYIPFIREIIALDPDMGILLIELPPLSMHITSSPIPGRTPILKALDAILTSLQIKRFVLVSHSYGTFLAAYLLRLPNDPSLEFQNKATPSYGTFSTDQHTQTSPNLGPNSDPERQLHHALASKVAHAILIDPIPILLHLHSVAYNFLYRTPHSAAEWQLWYFASRDPDVARTLHRAFFWEEGCLWGDDLVRFVCGADVSVVGDGDGDDLGRTRGGRNLAVVLAGKDQIVPADTVRGYLTGELQPNARWLGKARCSGPSSSSTTYPWFVKTDEDGVRGGQNLEVLFYPELDHATVFDTRERRKPILNVIERFAGD